MPMNAGFPPQPGQMPINAAYPPQPQAITISKKNIIFPNFILYNCSLECP